MVLSGPVSRDALGRVLLSDKTVSGLAQLADAATPVTLVTLVRPAGESDTANLGNRWREPSDLPFAVHCTDRLADGLDAVAPEVVLAPLRVESAPLLGGRRPVVLVAENPLRERLRYAFADLPRRVDRARLAVGLIRQAPVLRRLVRQSAGLQCNGFAAWEAYRRHAVDPLLFFDSRVDAATVASAAGTPAPARPGRLRLGFSGRLARQKGPEYAVRLHRTLRAAGHEVTLDVFGSGPVEASLRADAVEGVTFHGTVDFRSEWIPRVRDSIDVMVTPHIQGDPSGTYAEAMGVGVPLLGFANAALAPLVARHQVGWAVPIGDEQALLAAAVRLVRDPGEGARARRACLDFMATHAFEPETARRRDHALSCAEHWWARNGSDRPSAAGG